jgi:hypothetical protein
VLLALVIRALLILWDSQKINRKITFTLGLYVFVYLSNSFISPITLAHKYIFWAVLGFIIGQVYRSKSSRSVNRSRVRIPALILLPLFLTASGLFAAGQVNYLVNVDKFGRDNQIVLDYTPSPVIPCFMYFDTEFLMVEKRGREAVLNLADDELRGNPRCISALILKAQNAIDNSDLTALRRYAYRLHEIAPARSKSIELGMYYATQAGDSALASRIQSVMDQLNLIYLPGPAPTAITPGS